MKIALEYVATHWRDGLEVLILWFIIYQSYKYFRATRGARIFTGLVGMWVGLTLLSAALDLDVIAWILEKIAVFLALALVVIFQPELRRALAELGSHKWFSSFGGAAQRELTEELCDIVLVLSRKRIGALLAIERNDDLKQYLETGVSLDCKINQEIIQTVFHSGTPLHDGGMILRIGDERILGAGCVFPLNQRELGDRAIGLRHRAAMGITEESDAIAIVVSEETGVISLAAEGTLTRNIEPEDLQSELSDLLFESEDEEENAAIEEKPRD